MKRFFVTASTAALVAGLAVGVSTTSYAQNQTRELICQVQIRIDKSTRSGATTGSKAIDTIAPFTLRITRKRQRRQPQAPRTELCLPASEVAPRRQHGNSSDLQGRASRPCSQLQRSTACTSARNVSPTLDWHRGDTQSILAGTRTHTAAITSAVALQSRQGQRPAFCSRPMA